MRKALIVITCVVLTACTGMGEAWRHRVGGEPAVIGFSCDAFTASAQLRAENSAVAVFLIVDQITSGQHESVAGELPTDWPGQELPITFLEPLPIDVIATDVEELLTSLGYIVAREPDDAAHSLEFTVTRLESGHEEAGWTELKGTTWAQIDVSMTVIRGPDDRWLWELTQRGEKEIMAFLASHVESAYEQAYCSMLEELEGVFQSAEFAELVR